MECTSDAVSTEMSISVPFAVASWLESKSYLGLFIFLYLYTTQKNYLFERKKLSLSRNLENRNEG